MLRRGYIRFEAPEDPELPQAQVVGRELGRPLVVSWRARTRAFPRPLTIVLTMIVLAGGLADLVVPGLAGTTYRCGLRGDQRLVNRAIVRAYPMWAAMSSDPDGCPALAELGKVIGQRRIEDVHGRAVRIVCRPDTIEVVATGPDRLFGTVDDISSEVVR